MIYDFISVGIFVVLIIICAHRGAARSLAGIVIAFVSYTASTALGKILASYLYTGVIDPVIHDSVTNSVNQITADAADSAISALPSWLTAALSLSGEDATALLAEPLSGVSESAYVSVDKVVHPMVEGVLTFFITILLFFLISLLLRKLVLKPVLRIFRLPLINGVNKVLGGVLGAINAFLLVSMLAFLLKLFLPHIHSQSTIFNESTIYNSFIFYHFYSGNIFSTISSWITV